MTDGKFMFFFICFSLSLHNLFAQETLSIKFGKISQADFKIEAPKFDSEANVLIIADIGKTSFEGNDKGFFTLIFTRFIRVKIMNKNGFDIGSQNILLFHYF